jgi:WD40 repeat protein
MAHCHPVQLQPGAYVLQLAHKLNNLAGALSDQTCAIIDLQTAAIRSGIEVLAPINRIEFAHTLNECLFTVSNASCALWDLRAHNSKLTFAEYLNCPVEDHDSDAFALGPFGSGFLCGDMNDSGFFATGDHVGNIQIWDIRMPNKVVATPLGVISEFHTGMITQLRFHPNFSNILFSGSEDGLVQKFDLNASHVEDSLICGKHIHDPGIFSYSL